jgi:hypothetical protein
MARHAMARRVLARRVLARDLLARGAAGEPWLFDRAGGSPKR